MLELAAKMYLDQLGQSWVQLTKADGKFGEARLAVNRGVKDEGEKMGNAVQVDGKGSFEVLPEESVLGLRESTRECWVLGESLD